MKQIVILHFVSHSKIETLFLSGRQVFNVEDLCLCWQMEGAKDVAQLASYYVKEQRLFRLKNGLYSIIANPDTLQIAQKVLTPSYVTYQSALKYWGINFQVYPNIHSASLSRRRIQVQDVCYEYHQFPNALFFSPLGIVQKTGFAIASPERAIIDSLYINPTTGFDNLENINVSNLHKLAQFYNKPRIWKALLYYFPQILQSVATHATDRIIPNYAR